jgi:STE24 endopeptidase
VNVDKASRYHRLRRRLTLLSIGVSAALLIGLLVSGGSATLRDMSLWLARSLGASERLTPWLVVSTYVVLLAMLHEIVSFPIDFVHGFLLDRRYGLSVQTSAGWLKDHVKGRLVGLVLGLAAASILYGTLRAWPERWWLITGVLFAAASVVLAQLAPIVLLPLFYRFKPIENDTLKNRLLDLAQRARTRVLGVYEWQLGDKTNKANAALVGINGTRRILLSDTLMHAYSEDEIEVILAHELAHHVHGDLMKGMALDSCLTIAAFGIADRVLRSLADAAALSGLADVAGLPILLLAIGAVSVGFVPLGNLISRAHERRADHYALEMTQKADAFIAAMRRLASQNLAEERPSRAVELLFYTHPPIADRISAARDWVKREESAARQRA